MGEQLKTYSSVYRISSLVIVAFLSEQSLAGNHLEFINDFCLINEIGSL